MILNNESNGFLGTGYPFFSSIDNNDNIKMSHDEYKVFVNDDYIGKKILLSEKEQPEDLNKYLYSQGFENFKSEIVGGNVIIHCNNNIDKFESILNSYLKTR